ncbi:hypothetical protein [Merismopedia glauca]|uniref:Uncharacterized protein n=1 Tax=Merismopedia glauca CCAP 1448/3 TaxID=1296344 RepID=A0A2T1BX24_9CYAN|nr:hypothetical protein [Merismopedia glauca]PSB00566.1 hypothetical protein C7B64_22880 [Merismopedia glauca CCAP 1448/3]
MSRGRYAIPAGSIYVFKRPLERNWWEFPDEWFPEARMKDGEPRSLLKKVGCGLCLPIEIQGVN